MWTGEPDEKLLLLHLGHTLKQGVSRLLPWVLRAHIYIFYYDMKMLLSSTKFMLNNHEIELEKAKTSHETSSLQYYIGHMHSFLGVHLDYNSGLVLDCHPFPCIPDSHVGSLRRVSLGSSRRFLLDHQPALKSDTET